MVNFGNLLQYLAVQSPQQILSGDQLNTTAMAQYRLPQLGYEYKDLEPYISKQIMELHHGRHHQAYVDNLNKAMHAHVAALASNNIADQIALQATIKFNGGGHINHCLFWENLALAGSTETHPQDVAPKLVAEITKVWGSVDAFMRVFDSTLLGIQGSGWGWLVKDGAGQLRIITTKDQDPVGGGEVPILGIDMWEHAYYLQYLNSKVGYLENIWNVINWKTAEERFLGTREDAFATLKKWLV